MDILFYAFAGFTVLTALLVIFQPNTVGAAMALVASFFGVALLFVLLQAHFIAIMQLLLYAGAIMVFFVFVIMLLNLEPKQLRWRAISGSRLLQGSAAVYLLALLLFGLYMARSVAVAESTELADGTVEAVGQLLLSRYVVPFEITSILLFVAIIGAVVLGKRETR